MKTSISLLVLLGALELGGSAAADQIFYETGFEAPAFDTSLVIRGQDDWEMWRGGDALSIATTYPNAGTQCLRIAGDLLELASGTSARAYCFYRSITEKTNNQTPPIVLLEVDARLDGPRFGSTANDDILSANFMAVVPRPEGEGQFLAGFFVSCTGHIWTYSSVPEDNYKHSVPYVFGTYRRLGLKVDFIARAVTYLVDGVVLDTLPFPSTVTTDQLISGYLELHGQYDPQQTSEFSYDRANYHAYFDNYRITFVTPAVSNMAIKFSQDLYLADEYHRKAELKLERTGSLVEPVRVKIVATDDTAIAGEDYEAFAQWVTLPAGERSTIVAVPLPDNTLAEPDKSFNLTLSDLPNGATSSRTATRVLIRDNERPGGIDPTWSYRIERPRGAMDQAAQVSMTEQPDGKIVATFDLEGSGESILVRLHPDGSRDASFQGQLRGSPAFVSLLPDGKFLLIETVQGVAKLRRLNADGSPDQSFTAQVEAELLSPEISAVGLPDGRLVLCGFSWLTGFRPTRVDGQEMPDLVRLNHDGSFDPTFVAPEDIRPSMVRRLPDGKLLVSTGYSATPVYRLNENGAIDPAFQLATVTQGASDEEPHVESLIAQPDGKILIAGKFHQINGLIRNSIARLNADGSVDDGFRTGLGFTISGRPASIQCKRLPSGHVIVYAFGPSFDEFDGQNVPRFSIWAPWDTNPAPILLEHDGSWNRDFYTSQFDWGVDPSGGAPSGPVLSVPIPVGVAGGKPIFSNGWGLRRLIVLTPVDTDIAFAQDTIQAAENAGSAQVTLTRLRSLDTPVSVRVSTADDTAKAGQDYAAISVVVAFAPGEESKTVDIPLIDNSQAEPDKLFKVRLSDLPNGATSARSEASVIIRDNDGTITGPPGSLDPTWTPTLGLPPEDLAYADLRPLIPLADGRMIVCAAVYGLDFSYPLYRQIVRLNADGSVDPTFPIRTASPLSEGSHFLDPRAVAMPDGGLLVWDSESTDTTFLGYRFRWRILPDGSVDDRWPEITTMSGGSFEFIPQPDGKVLVTDFSAPILLNGDTMPWLFRLNGDGSVDNGFAAPTQIPGRVRLLAGGKILVETNTTPAKLHRLNPDGSLDSGFQQPASLSLVSPFIHPLPNGQTLVLDSTRSNSLLHRLNPDGSLDPTFVGGVVGVGNNSTSLARIEVLENGKLLLVGYFKSYNGVTVNGIVRLEANGAIDTTFRSGTGFALTQPGPFLPPVGTGEIWPLPGGRFLVGTGGNYDSYDGQPVSGTFLMNADGTRDATFVIPKVNLPWGLDTAFLFDVVDGRPIVHAGTGPGRLIMPAIPAADAPPRITSIHRDTAGLVRISVESQAGRSYTLQASADMIQWIEIRTETATSNRVEFAHENASADHFYRVLRE